MTPIPTIDDAVVALDAKIHAGDFWSSLEVLRTELTRKQWIESVVPVLIAAFHQLRRARGRNEIMFELIKFAKVTPEVVELALQALNDRAFLVRVQACAALAYSEQIETVSALKQLLQHDDPKTRQNADAAIDAIENHNHYFSVNETWPGPADD